MDPEQKINIKSDPTLKIGSTKISILKENFMAVNLSQYDLNMNIQRQKFQV